MADLNLSFLLFFRLELNLDMFLSLRPNLCKVPPQLFCDGVTIILTFVVVVVVVVVVCW